VSAVALGEVRRRSRARRRLFKKAFLARGESTVEHIEALDHVSKLCDRAYDRVCVAMVRRVPLMDARFTRALETIVQ